MIGVVALAVFLNPDPYMMTLVMAPIDKLNIKVLPLMRQLLHLLMPFQLSQSYLYIALGPKLTPDMDKFIYFILFLFFYSCFIFLQGIG